MSDLQTHDNSEGTAAAFASDEGSRNEIVRGRLFAVSLRWDVGPRAALTRECPDPVRVISAICEQH
jgi:hypothetical protein